MKDIFSKTLLTAFSVAALVSCKKDPIEPVKLPELPSYSVPTTYDFGTSTSYKPSENRINMLKEFIAYIRSAHTSTAQVTLDQNKLFSYFENSGSPFSSAELNSSGLSLKEKTSNQEGLLSDINIWLPEAAAASQSTAEAKDGTAGKILGPVPTNGGVRSAWLLNAYGFEFKELVEKGLMGGLMYSEATTKLHLIGTFDNSVKDEKGATAMERAWDEAFGYFGVPAAFPTTTTGLSYWGNYCNSVNAAIGSNAAIMDAFLKGRAAISNKDYTTRDAQRDIVVTTWEKVAAAKLIAYLKQAKNNIAEAGPRSHALSEGYGFIRAFVYNPVKKISNADIDQLLDLLGNNLYQVSATNIDQAISKVSTVFSLDAAKL